jgi:hypothetical protein
MAFKQVMEMRKSGNHSKAYELAKNDYQQSPDDIWAKRAMAWCIIDSLKEEASHSWRTEFIDKLEEMKALVLPSDETMVWTNIVWPINTIVRDCSKEQNVPTDFLTSLFEAIQGLPFVKPSLEYSVLLKAFMTCKEKWMAFTEFCDWWGFENFREEDYVCEVLPNGKKMTISTVESTYLAYAKQLIEKNDQEAIAIFIPKMQKLAEAYPEMQYPSYYLGKLLLAAGDDGEETLNSVLPFVRKKQTEFWAWQLLAEALEKDDEKCMACLLRAVHCNTQDQFLVNLYLMLANAFQQLKYYADARYYLDKYFQVKQDTQASVSRLAASFKNQDWYSKAAGQTPSYQLDYMTITNELLFHDIPETDAVVSFVNKDKKMATVVYKKGKEGFFKYDRFLSRLNTGDMLKIRIQEVSADGFMKLFSVRLSETPVVSDYCKSVTGTVSSNMSMTTFFLQSGKESFYIPPTISTKMQLIVGEPVSAIVLYSYNKKKEEWKWNCIKVKR